LDSTLSERTSGGGAKCVTEKRIKEWRKHFDVAEDEELLCSEWFFVRTTR
jgi:hypothetical protein